ncbi:MAG TPA: NrfD/PsrC family molybdoenzyme membrane anchor subunit [Gemmatimonadales bacterium]|nr:NrfD/PsrC family molybdoenzyme membrane anchor subunit [Gemmatimonadales bacterium]
MATLAHPETPAAARVTPTYAEITRDIVATLGKPGRTWYVVFGLVLAVLGWGIFALLYQIRFGLGVAGYSPPVMWGVYITTFVFWVGIAHCGTLVSAVLYLFRSAWRTAVYRTAEVMTVFAVLTAGLFPLIHVGRIWYAYWLIPYPNQRQLWVNFKSPLLWDVFAVTTYLTVSTLFLIVGMIPDVAAARDKMTGWRKKLYELVAIGWRGTDQQWRHYLRAYLYLAALATPLVLSVHSVVSWDFAMSIVPGWHTTIFAPYFVAGAIYSGLAMVITLIVPLRKAFKVERYIHEDHIENLAKLVLLTGMIIGYAYAMEYFIAWYSGNPYERAAFYNRAFGEYWWATWTMIICNAFLPILLWFRKVRRSIPAMFVLSLFINLGMWFERFVIIVVSLSYEYEPYAHGHYTPSWVDWSILAGSFGWFFMWFLLFAKNFPMVSIAEVKEIIPMPRRERAHA